MMERKTFRVPILGLLALVLLSHTFSGINGKRIPEEPIGDAEKDDALSKLENLMTPLPTVPDKLMMTGGPSNPHPRAFKAMAFPPTMGVVDPHTFKLLDEVKEGLRYVFQTKNKYTFVGTGNGHMGIEAMLFNLIEPNETVLIPTCGMWGQRVADMAWRAGATVKQIEKPMGTTFSLEEIEEGLKKYNPDVLYLIHGESSTGVVQTIEGAGDLCRKYDCLLAVDTVGTIGAVPFYVDKWKIDAAFCNTQKGLAAYPGLAPMTFGPRAIAKILGRKAPIQSWMSDVPGLATYWGLRNEKTHRHYHHTVPIFQIVALREALSALIEETLEKSWERHTVAMKRANELFEEMGLEHFVPNPKDRLVTTVTLKIPAGIQNVTDILNYALDERRVDMGAGLGPTLYKVIRVGIMGANAYVPKVETALDALKAGIAFAKGLKVEP